MSRTISWFSRGAASAVASKLSAPDVLAFCDTGSEDPDNDRFMRDCEEWLGQKVTVLKSEIYTSTWDVWEKKQYISGINGAPCTGALKIKPRLAFQLPDDLHIFGYTSDKRDRDRAEALQEHYPDLKVKFPLIEQGLTKANCLELVERAGLTLPRVYGYGFPNANCIPCCKATSPAYWAMVRHYYPLEFYKMVDISRRLKVRLCRLKGERIYIDQLPSDQPLTAPIAPECDMLCQLVEFSH